MRRSRSRWLATGQHGQRRSAALAVVAVAVAGCEAATAGAAARHTTASPAAHPAPSRSVASRSVPGRLSGGFPRIMIVGDSITKGSSGDYTWQYRLYEHLRADGVSPQMVGPYNWLFNNVTNVDGDCSYADPKFERANDARWGMTLFEERAAIRAKVATYRPSYLLV